MLYLENKGVTPYEFYKESGVTRGILQQNNGISEDNIARFLAYAPDVNIEWLLTSKGSMIKDGSTDIQISNDTTTSAMPTTSMNPGIGTPYYDVDFIGGFDEVFNSQVNIPATNIVIRDSRKPASGAMSPGTPWNPK